MRYSKGWGAALIVMLLLILDQALKIWIKTHMQLHESIEITPWFYLYFTENPGMAFGIEVIGKLFLSVFRIIAVVFIGYYLYKLVKQNYTFGFIACISLIFAGAIGNIIDSIFYGVVFDHSFGQVASFMPEGGGYASWLHGKVVDMFYFPLIQTVLPDWVPVWGGEEFVFFRPIFNLADCLFVVTVLPSHIVDKSLKRKIKELMRNKLHRYGVVLLLGTLLVACSKVPDGILSEKKMQAVQVDMQLAEAMINLDSKEFSDNARKEALYQSIFRKYDITQAEYDSSLVWYGRHLDIYMKVYDRVLADLNERQKALGDVQASAAPVSKQDSVDIWPRRTSLRLEPDALFNGVTFDIKPETNYSSGSSFVLGMNVLGINEGMAYKPEIRISADQGDTIVTVNDKVLRDGYHETVLKTVPTKQVKRVYGYIFMNNADSSYYKVYLDSLNLMKYNYGRLTDMAKDSSAVKISAVE